MSDGNLGYIVAAYGLVWLGVGAYVLRRWRRLAALSREVRAEPDAAGQGRG